MHAECTFIFLFLCFLIRGGSGGVITQRVAFLLFTRIYENTKDDDIYPIKSFIT